MRGSFRDKWRIYYVCRLFIGIGSQAEYGRKEVKLSPSTPVSPETGYGYAKLCAGLMTRELAHQIGLQHIWIRILSVYGPGDGATSMISYVIRELMEGHTPELTEGTQQWDYLFSRDAAEALYQVAEKGIDGKTYVLGSGQSRQLKDYTEEIKQIISPVTEIKYGVVPFSQKQIMHLCADISELKKDTGWMPKIDFSEGIRIIVEQLKSEV